MAKTYAQAIAEIRSLSGGLLAEGCPAVALVGVSLGAYLAGLTGCGDARLASIVMIMPAARMGLLLSQAARSAGGAFKRRYCGGERRARNWTGLR